MIHIQGTPFPSLRSGFKIDLCSGAQPWPQCDVGLSMNVQAGRGPAGRLILTRSAYVSQQWRNESKSPNTQVTRGQTFEMIVLAHQDRYKIAINGQHFCDFTHVLPLHRITHISIEGEISVVQIRYQVEATPQPPAPGYPHPGYPHPGPPQPAPPPVSPHTVVYNPPIPYFGQLVGGMYPGRAIRVCGHPLASAKDKFAIRLMVGSNFSASNDVGFTFSPRFKEQQVVRNSRQGGKWGKEERHGGQFPFRPGMNFDLTIHCDPDKFWVDVNGSPLVVFPHRLMPTQRLDTVQIAGEVNITMVSIQ